MTKFSAPQQSQLAQIGAFLRDNREKQSKSLEDIAIRTYIRPQLLSGIETGDPDLLPEPIFVQGFIRRYGEALGLDGIELSQQFTVTSIPSTPRPARQAPPADSTMTRLSRSNRNQNGNQSGNQNGNQPPAAAQPLSNDAIARPSLSNGSSLTGAPLAGNTVEDLTLGRPKAAPDLKPEINPVPETETALDQNSIDQGFVSDSDLDDTFSRTVDDISADSSFNSSFISSTAEADFDTQLDDRLDDTYGLDETTYGLDEANGAVTEPAAEATPDSLGSETAVPASLVEEDFVNQIAAFDRANLNQTDSGETSFEEPHFEESNLSERTFSSPDNSLNSLPDSSLDGSSGSSSGSSLGSSLGSSPGSNGTALNSQATLGNAQSNHSFDDELPAAFTTEASPTEASPFKPEASPKPVGVELNRDDQPNLKPFIIGGVVAALAAGAIILASVLGGGGNRQPSVANSPDTPNEAVQAGGTLPPVPAETAPKEAVTPPVSTAPVYVEATATDAAWVSIITDGTTIFEGTLQPGDRKVWEAQKSINIYSANAGGLKVAANGGKAEVMGKPGQLAEKTFTQ